MVDKIISLTKEDYTSRINFIEENYEIALSYTQPNQRDKFLNEHFGNNEWEWYDEKI